VVGATSKSKKKIDEYIEDLDVLVDAVHLASEGINLINAFADNLIEDLSKRFAL